MILDFVLNFKLVVKIQHLSICDKNVTIYPNVTKMSLLAFKKLKIFHHDPFKKFLSWTKRILTAKIHKPWRQT